mmetsp:Transcript_13034/g.24152  ORF Transcript_13034/g.24152 Transcript_13034/m.24152 type:complete len:346 (+) Transcript_13034:193-1230(+)
MRGSSKVACVVAAVAAAVAGRTEAQATENIMVSVTIPVSVPLEVPAGQSFGEAARNFVERNNLNMDTAPVIENALAVRWEEMQRENIKRNQCATWQMQHEVYPLKDWGTLPVETRELWVQYDCDSYVPAEPPSALVSLDVAVGESILVLRAFPGDTVQSSVERFTAAHGIDFEQSGQLLIDALEKKIAEEIKIREQEASTFLFSLPINVDGKLVRLRVHEGDEINALVSNFCKENDLDEAKVGGVIRQSIIDTTEQLKQQLEQEEEEQQQQQAAKQAVEKEEEPQLLLDIPINVDGKEFNMKLYDGDYVDVKIAAFCEMHGLDQEAHGKMILQHVTERTQGLQAQ